MEAAGNILEYLAYWFKAILDAIEKVAARFGIELNAGEEDPSAEG